MKTAVFFTVDDKFRTLGYAQAVHLARTQSVDVHLFDEGREPHPPLKDVAGLTIHRGKLASFVDKNLPTNGKWPHIVYGRLFVPHLLADYDRLLYLDADVAVIGDLAPLMTIDMQGNILSAVHDADLWSDKSPIARCTTKIEWLRSIGVTQDFYFNSGVLLFDVAKYREIDIPAGLTAYFRDYAEMVTMWDQDFLNYRFQGQWKEISLIWNFQSIAMDSGFLPLMKPVILHFNEIQKPWHRGYYFGARQHTAYFQRIAAEAGVDIRSFPAFVRAGAVRRSKYAIRHFLHGLGLRWTMPKRRVKEALDRRAALPDHLDEVRRTGRHEVDDAAVHAMREAIREARIELRFNGNEVWNTVVDRRA